MDVTSGAAVVGLCLTMLGMLFTFVRFVGSGIDSVRTELAEQVRAARTESDVRIERIVENEVKSRQAMLGSLTAMTSKLETDLDRLKRESVRRDEMTALENRMNAILMKIETKLDSLVSRLGDLRGLEAQIKSTGERLDEIAKRLERSDC